MKTLLVVLALLSAAPARAALYYSNEANASSDTMRVGGVIKVTDPASPYVPTITLNGVGGVITATTLTGNAATATALAANGANCSAGNYPLGVDASGAAESCTAAPVVSSATAIRDYNGDLTVPYGVVAASVTATSVTATNAQVSSGTLAVNGTEGAFNVDNGTFSVGSPGIVSALSQPTAILTCNSNCLMTSAVANPVYWDTNQSVTQSMHSVSVSSQNVLIPAGGGGLYSYDVLIGMTDPGVGGFCYLDLYKNTSTKVDMDIKGRAAFSAGDYNFCKVSGKIVLAAGDTLSVKFTQSRGGADFNLAAIGFPANHFHVTKDLR